MQVVYAKLLKQPAYIPIELAVKLSQALIVLIFLVCIRATKSEMLPDSDK